MKVVKQYNQHRRDLRIDLECENCGAKETDKSAYDDTNFWVNVVPNMSCKECHVTSADIGLRPESIGTKYPEWFQV